MQNINCAHNLEFIFVTLFTLFILFILFILNAGEIGYYKFIIEYYFDRQFALYIIIINEGITTFIGRDPRFCGIYQ